MPQASYGLVELVDWLTDTIEPLQGHKWQIVLNSDGTFVEATVKAVQSERDNGRGHKTTISAVTTAKFRISEHVAKRTTFSTD